MTHQDWYQIAQLKQQADTLLNRINWMQEIIERPSTPEPARLDLLESVQSYTEEYLQLLNDIHELEFPYSSEWRDRAHERRYYVKRGRDLS